MRCGSWESNEKRLDGRRHSIFLSWYTYINTYILICINSQWWEHSIANDSNKPISNYRCFPSPGGYLWESQKMTIIQESIQYATNSSFNPQGFPFIPVTLHHPEGFTPNPSWSFEGEMPGEFHRNNEIAVSLVHYLLWRRILAAAAQAPLFTWLDRELNGLEEVIFNLNYS